MKETDSFTISGSNQQIYQRLKQALSLNLRRQIFIAVCDDLCLRNHLVARLQAELAYPNLPQSTISHTLVNTEPAPAKFVNLELDSTDPNPWQLIRQWLAQNSPRISARSSENPGFQIVGIERLTRQPATVQWSFLKELREIDKNISCLESSLLLWLPRPWLYSIQQSAPEFWRWRTGVFEFAGEPTLDPQIEDRIEEKTVKSSLSLPPHATEPPDLDNQGLSLELLRSIEQLHQQQASPEVLTAAYQKLGNFYRERLTQGDVSQHNVIMGIRALEQALDWGARVTAPNHLVLSPDLFQDLGTLYWHLSRLVPGTSETIPQVLSHLDRGLQLYQHALHLIDPEVQPQMYARVQKNLGMVHAEKARYQDPPTHLQQAILAYQKALLYLSAETDAQQYVATQNNLGAAFWNLAQHTQPVSHLKSAITAYSQALSYYSPELAPLNYAMLQNNLGTAYWNLAQYDPSESLLLSAVQAYHEALKYRTPEQVPAPCAATQNNLGTAYWHLANHPQTSPAHRAQYLQQGILAYESVLKIAQTLDPTQLTFDLWATHNNLGLAHYQRAIDAKGSLPTGAQTAHLEAALDHHLQAYRGYQRGQGEHHSNSEGLAASPSPAPEGVTTLPNQAATLGYIIKTLRGFYRELGLTGQNTALSKIPGDLLPEVLRRL